MALRLFPSLRQIFTQNQTSISATIRTMSSTINGAVNHVSQEDKNYTVLTKDVLKFLDDVHDTLMREVLEEGSKRENKVVNFQHPKDLKKVTDLEITEEGQSHERLLEAVKKHIKYSVQTGQPRFFNQQFAARDPYGLAAAWTTEALNTNAHTFEVAPAFVVVERYMVEKMLKLVGYEQGDGLFFPGGNTGMMAAIHLAKYKRNPKLKHEGLFSSKPLALFMSEDAHYGAKTAAAVTGLGLDNVYAVKGDATGRMSLDDLEKKVEEAKTQGKEPFFVVATTGTTVIGAFDELNPIADICQKHGIWLHVDAAWGGGCLLSRKHRHLLKGVERADSFLWNAHKIFSVPLQCTVLLNKHKLPARVLTLKSIPENAYICLGIANVSAIVNAFFTRDVSISINVNITVKVQHCINGDANGLFEECNSVKAQYLYQQDKFYDVTYDIGDKSIQCGRKPDAFKLWLMWKACGDNGMEAMIDKKFDNARYFTEELRKREGFRLCLPEFEFLNISFWYIPNSLRGQEETSEWWDKLSKVAPQIKEGMTRDGTMLIGYNPLSSHGLVNFFRIILSGADHTYHDMDFVLDEIERLGKDL